MKLFILLLSIFVCSGAVAEENGVEPQKNLMRDVVHSKNPISTLSSFKENSGLFLGFWSGPDAEKHPEYSKKLEPHHACGGNVIYDFIKSIPKQDDPYFNPDKVVEITSTGKVLREWGIPVDRYVAAIQNNMIIVPMFYSDEGAQVQFSILIKPDGEYNIGPASEFPAPISIACPQSKLFEGSAYKRCWEHKDVITGKKRILMYEGPCT